MDRETLEYLVEILKGEAQDQYEILFDQDLEYGEDFRQFMDLLETVDTVLVILTPEYKKRVQERRAGVYQEFRRIVLRHDEVQESRREGKKISEIVGYFDLVPILFSGTSESSVPDEIVYLNWLDLVGLRVVADSSGNPVLSSRARRQYLPKIKRITDRLRTIQTLKTPAIEELFEKYFNRLFVDLKADWSNPRDRDLDYIENLFVKTHVFQRVQSQAVYFIIGRKGSGKSTVAVVLSTKQEGKYKIIVKIDADKFNLHFLYAMLSPERVRSDIQNIFTAYRCFELAWELFIALCCLEELARLARAGELSDYELRSVSPLLEFSKTLQIEDATEDLAGLGNSSHFTYALGQVTAFMEYCIDRARPQKGHFFADIEKRFTLSNLFVFVFGSSVLENLRQSITDLARGFLLTLDGFDTAFDTFRREAGFDQGELRRRAYFELEWLRSLLRLVIKVKQQAPADRPWFEMMDFCITVPKDRFLELLLTERDTYRYSERYCALYWSGIELAILLRKRLEELSQYSSDKRKPPEERLSDVFRNRFSHIPSDISFEFNGRQYSIPLFMYILRHTFWRPRDVLWFYARILATAELMRKKGQEVSPHVIRRIVKDTTYEVIRSEFLNELETTIINISDIVNIFSDSRHLFSYDDLEGKLAAVDFIFATGAKEKMELRDKIEFLYKIGFLGIMADSALTARFNLRSRHAFYFNEGVGPLRSPGKDKYRGLTFVIHPIFSEYLRLDTSGGELVLEFSWQYLHEMENLMFATATSFAVV